MTVSAPPTPLSAERIAISLGNPAPTEEQRQIVESPPDRPLLVVAGAGSGKTETMASRVVWLVANGHVEPDQVLGLTFTRKAATELAERIGLRLRRLASTGLWTPRTLDGDGAEALGGIPVVSTYHSYAGRLVREHALRLGVEPESRLLSEAAAWQYAAEVVARYDGPVEDVVSAESTIIEAVVSLAGEMAEHLLVPEDLVDYIDDFEARMSVVPQGSSKARTLPIRDVLSALRNRRAILPMVRDYLDLKRQRDALDFSDQMALAARLARDFPEIGAIERQRFQAVLLDEFQDTSEAQLVLLRSLFVRPGAAIRVTAVGDPNQSIYGWRGASATTLTRFPLEFGDVEGHAEVLQLSTSWRNDSRILGAANVTSGPLRLGDLRLGDARFEDAQPGDAQSALVAPLRSRPGAARGEVSAARFETVEEEAEHVAAWIAARWRRPSGSRSNLTAAVLCRKRAQFPLVVEALRRLDLPVEVVGLGGLLQTPEVSDLVALLWVVQDPSRGDRLMRLLTGPLCRLGAADLDGLASWARHQQARPLGARTLALPGLEPEELTEFEDQSSGASDEARGDESGLAVHPAPNVARDQAPESSERASIVEALDDLPMPRWRGPEGQRISETGLHRLAGLRHIMRSLRRLTSMPLADLVGEAERALGLDIEVLARPEHTLATARAHLDAFADVAAGFSASADRPTLSGFLSWLDAAVAQERGLDAPTIETSVDTVQVLTVHAAKGLEWDCVAVPGLVDASFPARETGAPSRWEDGSWVVSEPKDKGWCLGADGVPYDLRGDRDGLPVFPWRTAADWEELKRAFEQFALAGGAHQVAEERRLAYVAVTRARSALLLTASVWTDALTPKVTSPFLLELLAAPGLGLTLEVWADMPEKVGDVSPANPRLAEPLRRPWPRDPMAERRRDLADALERVSSVIRERGLSAQLDPATQEELDLLLAEREELARGGDGIVEVPRHLSASAVVQLAADHEQFAMTLRRPMPAEPALAARRGTAFHAWVEEHYAQAAMVDVVDLPGSADEGAPDDEDVPSMKRLFLASAWADRVPEAIEIPIETMLEGFAIRGRIDAVFARDDGGFTVVDWKTGAQPDGRRARTQALQLGAYALAYARLRGLAPSQVDAAFYYAQTGSTVHPKLPRERDLVALLAELPELSEWTGPEGSS
ncbi:MAG: ATP-dependent helicase [Actinomycetota bacterium]|nr:ATP-dependent helicase [Actinomycetota bacterium]